MPNKVKLPVIDINKEVRAAQKALAKAQQRLSRELPRIDPKKCAVGALSDFLYELRATGQALNSIATPFAELLAPCAKAIEDHFVATLPVGESSGVQGYLARVQITDTPIPVVADWDKFYAHIRKAKAFELLNKAVNRKAVQERWDNKKQVPGVTAFHAKKVSCTKLSKKKVR